MAECVSSLLGWEGRDLEVQDLVGCGTEQAFSLPWALGSDTHCECVYVCMFLNS